MKQHLFVWFPTYLAVGLFIGIGVVIGRKTKKVPLDIHPYEKYNDYQ